VVVEARDHSEVQSNKLRAAFEPIDEEPTYDAELLALLTWAADYYRHPIGEVLASALPVMLRGGAPVREEQFLWRLTALGQTEALSKLTSRSVRLRAIAEYLTKQPQAAATQSRVARLRREVCA
jgi:primosomal protein N' (replication factor Y)